MSGISTQELVTGVNEGCIEGKMTLSDGITPESKWRGVVVSCEIEDHPHKITVEIQDAERWTPERWVPAPDKDGEHTLDLSDWHISLDHCPHAFCINSGEVLEFREAGWSPIVRIGQAR